MPFIACDNDRLRLYDDFMVESVTEVFFPTEAEEGQYIHYVLTWEDPPLRMRPDRVMYRAIKKIEEEPEDPDTLWTKVPSGMYLLKVI